MVINELESKSMDDNKDVVDADVQVEAQAVAGKRWAFYSVVNLGGIKSGRIPVPTGSSVPLIGVEMDLQYANEDGPIESNRTRMRIEAETIGPNLAWSN